MTLIAQYNHAGIEISAMNEAKTAGYGEGKFIKFGSDEYCVEVLNAITIAAECGILYEDKFVSQCFKSKKAFKEFIEAMEVEDGVIRVKDRWAVACAHLTGWYDEEGFTSMSEVAEKLYEAAEATNQI